MNYESYKMALNLYRACMESYKTAFMNPYFSAKEVKAFETTAETIKNAHGIKDEDALKIKLEIFAL